MAVQITAGQIDRDEVVITINIRMSLKDWKLFYRELPGNLPFSTQVKDGLMAIFNRIK